jgi:hypothetical protein
MEPLELPLATPPELKSDIPNNIVLRTGTGRAMKRVRLETAGIFDQRLRQGENFDRRFPSITFDVAEPLHGDR